MVFKEVKSGVQIDIYVQPNGKKSEIIGMHDGRLKVRIKAPPVDGKANDEIISFFSSILKVTQRQAHVVRGELSRKKTIEITNVNFEEVKKTINGYLEASTE